MPGPAVDAYLAELTRRLAAGLRPELVGVYLMGSAAMGAYEPGVSDLDVWAVLRGPVPRARRRALVARVDHAALPCPARGLELVAARFGPAGAPIVELNLDDGPAMARHLSLEPGADPAHWFVLDAAIGRERARALMGPPAREAFPLQPRSAVLAAVAASLDWHARNDPDGPDALLNALRGLRYAAEGVWGSKREAAAWAAARRPDWASQIRRALDGRTGPRLTPCDDHH